MGKIRVLHMPLFNVLGGVEQYVFESWRFIDKTRFAFDIATRSELFDLEEQLASQGCTVHRYRTNSVVNPSAFRDDIRMIMGQGYDIVHLHTSYWNGIIAEEVAMDLKIPKVIVHSHNTGLAGLFSGGTDAEFKAVTLKHESIKSHFALNRDKLSTNLCACSKAAANWLFDETIPRNEIRILKNGIDLERFSYKPDIRQAYRQKLGLNGCFVIGHVGRFVYQKNHDFLLEVFASLVQRCPTARLLLAGNGDLFEKTKDLACQLRINDKVIFLGEREDVHFLMQAMDVFMLPSHFEGLGIVLIEAQAAGLLCIASEHVPQESKVTENLEYLPLDASLWNIKLSDIFGGYDRYNGINDIRDAGYDKRECVKELEKFYLE